MAVSALWLCVREQACLRPLPHLRQGKRLAGGPGGAQGRDGKTIEFAVGGFVGEDEPAQNIFFVFTEWGIVWYDTQKDIKL